MKNETNAAKIKAIVEAVRKVGVQGIVFGFESEGATSTHIENTSMLPSYRIAIMIFDQVCEYEMNNRRMSEEYRAAVKELNDEFHNLLKAFNARVDGMDPKDKPSPETPPEGATRTA